MKKKNFNLLIAVLLPLLFNLSWVNAQETPQSLNNLFRLEGYWQGQANIFLEGKNYTTFYHANFKKTANGKGLLMEEMFNSADLGKFNCTNLIGYNTNDGKIHWFSVDNFGTVHDHVGDWENNDHFHMETSEMMEGKKYMEKIDIVFKGSSLIEVTLLATINGMDYEKVSVIFQKME